MRFLRNLRLETTAKWQNLKELKAAVKTSRVEFYLSRISCCSFEIRAIFPKSTVLILNLSFLFKNLQQRKLV